MSAGETLSSNAKEQVSAQPSKRFFVEMLTRDIELSDAILDLLDNSVDGLIRSRLDSRRKFFARLTLAPNEFTIEDNCGGIPRKVAMNYAFRFGRELGDTRDADLPTIGMYGIGMKRAIFKLGRSCTVTSRHGSESYEVRIDAVWHKTRDWNFPLLPATTPLDSAGTRITVRDLHPGVSTMFQDDAFRSNLVKAVWQHYSDFLGADFRVTINEKDVEPNALRLLYDESSVRPYYFRGDWKDVGVELAVGLNAPPGSTQEEQEEAAQFGAERLLDHAGWTIVCNGRPILYGDKSRVSCWGDGAPRFHPQFAVVSGVVEFTATDASLLPVTTTKRGVDMSAEVFLLTRLLMREGMTVFTRHTNRWKNYKRSEQEKFYTKATFLGIRDVFEKMRTQDLTDKRSPFSGKVFNPEKSSTPLPKPATGGERRRRITFSRPDAQVRQVAQYLLDDEGARPAHVGEACFDRVLGESERRR